MVRLTRNQSSHEVKQCIPSSNSPIWWIRCLANFSAILICCCISIVPSKYMSVEEHRTTKGNILMFSYLLTCMLTNFPARSFHHASLFHFTGPLKSRISRRGLVYCICMIKTVLEQWRFDWIVYTCNWSPLASSACHSWFSSMISWLRNLFCSSYASHLSCNQ